MPVFQLNKKLIFPHPSLAEDGLLAIGGDLSEERLLLAYENGIFPWYNEGEPIFWYAPNPRFVLFPNKIKVSKSMKKIIASNIFQCTINQDFKGVIKACQQQKRKKQWGTWITNDIENAYIHLHEKKWAHSVEVWNHKNELVGGLYGINMGSVFYGESMFHKENNASKMALIHLIQNYNFSVIDCQVHTAHLESLGAEMIDLEKFLAIIVKETKKVNLINRNSNFVNIEKNQL